MKKCTLFHGSGETVQNPEIRITRYTKDFGYGFYCTEYLDQAKRWANKHRKKVDKIPTVNYYNFKPSDELKTLVFEKMTDEWLDLIALCRSGGAHDYDIVEGPMADDEVWNSVEDFLAGEITREAFWAIAAFKRPTHQISFHTAKALKCLEFCREVHKKDGFK